MTGLLLAWGYMMGAYNYYVYITYSEMVMSVKEDRLIQVIPWQKSVACIFWPVCGTINLIANLTGTAAKDE